MRQRTICILAAIAVVVIGLGMVVSVALLQSAAQSPSASASQEEEGEELEENSDVSLISITIFLPEIAKAYQRDLSAPQLPGIDLGILPEGEQAGSGTAHAVEG